MPRINLCSPSSSKAMSTPKQLWHQLFRHCHLVRSCFKANRIGMPSTNRLKIKTSFSNCTISTLQSIWTPVILTLRVTIQSSKTKRTENSLNLFRQRKSPFRHKRQNNHNFQRRLPNHNWSQLTIKFRKEIKRRAPTSQPHLQKKILQAKQMKNWGLHLSWRT